MCFRQVLVLALVAIVLGHPQYQTLIPNGANVVVPCDNSPWPGVGHTHRQGAGPVNAFGSAFRAAGHVWTKALCEADSDGDGISNGAELGDPTCSWTPTNGFALGPVTGHPGLNGCDTGPGHSGDEHGHHNGK